MADARTQDTPLNFNEAIRDRTIRHMLFLEGVKTRKAREVIDFIDNDILPDLRTRLAERLDTIANTGFDRGTSVTARLETQIAGFTDITSRFRDINTRVQGELFEVAQDEADFVKKIFRQESGVDLGVTLPPPEVLANVVNTKPFDGKTLEQWYDRLAVASQEKVAGAIRQGVVEGRTTQQITSDVMAGVDVSRRQAEAIARSGVGHAANAARQQVFEANQDIVKGVMWNATLDSRTCLQCSPLDGKVFPVDSGPRPPIHPSCRCSVSGVTKSFRQMGIDADEVPAATRSSINGQVPGDITYNQWLKRQPVDVQEMALGAKKAKLFRDGGLDVNQFVNRNRVELTLDEIRRREGRAFAKAEL